VTCTRPGELAVGASSTITLTVLVGAGSMPSVLNTATADAPRHPTDICLRYSPRPRRTGLLGYGIKAVPS
jgi:hypothetical protein